MGWRDRLRRRDRHAEASAEIDAHIRMAIADRIEFGEPPDDARRNVHMEVGNVRLAIEDSRSVWRWTTLEQIWFDARHGARILSSDPGLSLTAILLIALVIGGNTTIYSAIHGMLTKPAPGVSPIGLVSIGWMADDADLARPETSVAHYQAVARESRHLQAAGFVNEQIAVTSETGTHPARAAWVSANYFDTLGIHPLDGRVFSDAEAQLGAGGLVALISERFWRERLGGAAGAVGSTLILNGRPAAIVGVTPAPFQGAVLAEATDIWVPLVAFARATGRERELETRSHVQIIGRLAAGASLAVAGDELRAIAARVDEAGPAGAPRQVPMVFPYTGVAAQDHAVARLGPRFLTIFSVVTLLTVIIVCANVANLMLARAVVRQREMAVRQSFGASRWRVTRIILAEALTIALIAWVIACLFTYWMSQALRGIIPPSQSGNVTVLMDFTPDWTVLGYAMLMAVAAAVTSAIAPAIRTWRQDLLSFLKAGERGIARGRSRATDTLVVVQLALSVMLLTSAGLAYRSLSLMSSVDLGFPHGNLLLVTVDSTATARAPQANVPLIETLLDAVRGVPGVESASYATAPPATAWQRRRVSVRPGRRPLHVESNVVGPAYLRTLGLRPLQGIEFVDRGASGRADAMINQHLADALWPGEPAVGRQLNIGDNGDQAVVIGVAPNALVGGYRREARPFLLLLSAPQTAPPGGYMTFYVRHAGSLEAVVPPITRALRNAAPGVPVMEVRTVEAELRDSTWLYRTLTLLLLMFAGGSLLIAGIGQYAAMAFSMRQRVRDFAIRMAMGATARQILTSAVRQGLTLTAAGLAAGLLLGSLAGRAARSLLHGVTPTDAATFAGVLVILGTASMLASYIPALRAARVNPVDALRSD